MMRIGAGFIGLALALVGPLALGFEIGERVIVARPANLKIERRIVGSVRAGACLRAENIQGRWLWVKDSSSGWIESSNVIALDQSIPLLTSLIRQNPCDARLYRSRARAWNKRRDHDKAIADCNAALRLNSRCAVDDINAQLATAYCLRAAGRYADGDLMQARRDIDYSLRLDANHVNSYRWRARLNARQSRMSEALADFTRAIALDPMSAGHLIARAEFCANHLGDLETAANDLDRALDSDPRSVAALRDRGVLYAKDNRYDLAIQHLAMASEVEPDNADVALNLAIACVAHGDYSRSLDVLNAIIEHDPGSAMAHYWRSLALGIQGQMTASAADYLDASRGNSQIGKRQWSSRLFQPTSSVNVAELAPLEASNIVVEADSVPHDGSVCLQVAIDNQLKWFVLDTGAVRTVIDTSLIPEEAYRESVILESGAGMDEGALIKAPDLRLGDLRLRTEETVLSYDLNKLRGDGNRKVSGILGMDVLRYLIVRLDLDRRKITILKAAGSEAGTRIEMKHGEDRPCIQATLAGDLTNWFLIDTGAGLTSINSRSWKQLSNRSQLELLGTVKVRTITGEIERAQGIVDSFQVGPFLHRNRVVAKKLLSTLSILAAAILEKTDSSNTLGLEYLSRYVVTFDFPGSAIYLSPGKRFAECEAIAEW